MKTERAPLGTVAANLPTLDRDSTEAEHEKDLGHRIQDLRKEFDVPRMRANRQPKTLCDHAVLLLRQQFDLPRLEAGHRGRLFPDDPSTVGRPLHPGGPGPHGVAGGDEASAARLTEIPA